MNEYKNKIVEINILKFYILKNSIICNRNIENKVKHIHISYRDQIRSAKIKF